MRIAKLLLMMVLVALGGSGFAAPTGEQVGIPTTMGKGVTETVAKIMARETNGATAAEPDAEEAAPNYGIDFPRRPNPASPLVATFPATAPQQQHGTPVPYAPQTLGLSFTGATGHDSGFVPPDTMGAVGPKQFIVTVNGRVRSFDKATGLADGALDTTTDNFWASVRSSSASDPRIRFDRLTQRWFMVEIDVSAPNRVMIAVSNGPVISAQSSFTFFEFLVDQVQPLGNTGCLADYPSIGIDVNAIYIGTNMFYNGNATCDYGTYGTQGATAFVVRKSSVLGTGPIVVTAFRGLSGPDPFNDPSLGDMWTPQGVDNDDPTATFGYFVGDTGNYWGIVNVRRVTDPAGTPTLSADIPVVVPMTNAPVKLNFLGRTGGPLIDGNDPRPIQSRIVNGSLYTTQGVSCDNTGVSDPSAPAGTDDRDCVRFYQIDSLDTAPTLTQAGTIFDSSAANPMSFTYGSMAVTGQGHAAFSFTSVGPTYYANGATTGRLATDPAGFTYTPTLNVTASSTAYNTSETGSRRRWGDYSAISVDPDDNMTVWGTSEYADSTGGPWGVAWGVNVTKLMAPPPATPSSTSPSFGVQGSTVNVTVTGVSNSGSGFYDPGSGFPKHLSASVSGGDVAVVGATYVSPTSVQLQLAIDNAAATGARDITITNPDGQSITGTGIFTVNAGACASATLSPASVPGGQIGDVYSQQFSVTGGSGTYTFTSSGTLPAGTSLSSAGLLSGTLTADGTYNFTVIASNGSCNVVQGFSVVVNSNHVSVQSGTPQSAWLSSIFGQPLKAQVLDASGNPVGGVTVTFTAPASGPTGTFPGNSSFATAMTDPTFGVATAPAFTANNTVGSYEVLATISGSAAPASFDLSNIDGIVTNTNDSGPGSLREVLNAAPSGGTVVFQAGLSGTIALTSGQLSVSQSVTIPGPGARTLSVSGSNLSRVFSIGPGITVNMSGLTITGGFAAGGAGIQNNGGTLSLTDVAIVGNVDVDGSVGTALDNEDGNVTILRCTIANNTIAPTLGTPSANTRGAIMNRGTTVAASITMTNSTVTGNSAGGGAGGALRNLGGAGATFTAINSTITNNTATTAGGNIARGAGTVTLQNTIVAGGTAASGPDISGAVVSNDYNLIQSTSGATISGTTTHNITGVAPNLGALANNGGQTDTQLPNAGSPVIDQGGAGGPSSDQRGAPRPTDDPSVPNADDGSDIGAVEVVAPTGISGIGLATPSTVGLAESVLLSVHVTPGQYPDSTGISVVADLSSIGGSATQAFTDDGTNTNTFVFTAIVQSSATLGPQLLPVTITDAQARNGSAAISLTVTAGTDGIFADGFGN